MIHTLKIIEDILKLSRLNSSSPPGTHRQARQSVTLFQFVGAVKRALGNC